MKFVSYKELKEIEKDSPSLAKKALLKSVILATTLVAVLVVLAPVFEENILFISLVFGCVSFIGFYSTTLYEIKLLKELKTSNKNIDKEVNQSQGK